MNVVAHEWWGSRVGSLVGQVRDKFAVEQIAEGVRTIKTAKVIPDDELWLHTPEMRESLDRALEWSASHLCAETDLQALARKVKRKL